MWDSGPGESAEAQAYRRAKLGVYYFDRDAGSSGRMFDLRLLNLISFGLLLLAFFIAAAKSDKQSSSERVMIERMKAAAEIVQSTKEKN